MIKVLALFTFSSIIFAEPLVELFPADSSMCRDHGAATKCATGSRLQFSDDNSCACLRDGSIMHPRKCMIGPMRCDVRRGQRYSWLHTYEMIDGAEVAITSGCSCVIPTNLSM